LSKILTPFLADTILRSMGESKPGSTALSSKSLGTAFALLLLSACSAAGLGGDDGGPPDRMVAPECAVSIDCDSPALPICLPDATCGVCKQDADCKQRDESAALCAADGACVSCRGAADCQDPALPVCDPTARACRACAADVECESGACDLAEGRCFAASDVYVVDDGGTCGGGDGSAGAPFCSLTEALAAFHATPRNFIAVRDGVYTFPPLASGALPAFIGTPDAQIGPEAAGGDCLKLDASGRLDLRGFHFKDCGTALRIGATATQVSITGTRVDSSVTGLDCKANTCVVNGLEVNDTTTGVRCSGGARCHLTSTAVSGGDTGITATTGATLLLHDSNVTSTRLYGVSIADSEAEVVHTTVREIGKNGTGTTAAVVCSASYCTIDRTRIVGSRGAGLALVNGSFEVYNSAILGNGSEDTSLAYNGGVVLVTPGSTRVFQNNTVVGNRAALAATAGVRCNAAVTLKSSIIWGNSGPPVDLLCSASYSDIDSVMVMPGTGNLRADPKLASVTPGAMDEHIAIDSPCIDSGDPSTTASQDIDGQERPSNGRVDIGADESEP
jgi:hypothetical protein